MSRELLGWSLLVADVAVKSTLVLAAAWIATRAARKAPAAARHLIWMISLGTLLLLPVLEAVAPCTTLFSIPTQSVVLIPPPAYDSALLLDQSMLPAHDAPSIPVAAQPVPATSNPENLVTWVVGAWVAGCAAVLLSALIGWIALNRIKARTLALPPAFSSAGAGRRVRLSVSREGRPPSALTWGALRPTILLPRAAEEWPTERLETVLLHELEHVRRWDAVFQLVGLAACAVYWFHPGAWLAAKAARAEAEAATDDAVLRRGVRPSAYANTLMEVAAEIGRRPHPISSAGVAFMKRSKIEARLRAILDGRTRRTVTRTEKAAAVGLAFALLIPLAFVRAAAVAPFAALPEAADPTVTIQVTPKHVTKSKLSKKQLAAQRAHHLRALAIQDRIAAERKAAENAAFLRGSELAGLTPEQAKQALTAESAVRPTKSKDATDSEAAQKAYTAVMSADARTATLATDRGSLTRVKAAEAAIERSIASVDQVRAIAKGSRNDALASAEMLTKLREASNLKVLAADGLRSQVDAKGIASALATVKGLTVQIDPKSLNAVILKSIQTANDAKGAKDAIAMTKVLLSQLDSKSIAASMKIVQDPTVLSDAKLQVELAKSLTANADAKVATGELAVNRALLSKLDAKVASTNARITQDHAAKRDADKAAQMLQQAKQEVERAQREVERADLAAKEAQLNAARTRNKAMAAQKGRLDVERLKMLEANRAMRDAARLKLKSEKVRTLKLNRVERTMSAKQRNAMLQRERAALLARLKAIEAELNKAKK